MGTIWMLSVMKVMMLQCWLQPQRRHDVWRFPALYWMLDYISLSVCVCVLITSVLHHCCCLTLCLFPYMSALVLDMSTQLSLHICLSDAYVLHYICPSLSDTHVQHFSCQSFPVRYIWSALQLSVFPCWMHMICTTAVSLPCWIHMYNTTAVSLSLLDTYDQHCSCLSSLLDTYVLDYSCLSFPVRYIWSTQQLSVFPCWMHMYNTTAVSLSLLDTYDLHYSCQSFPVGYICTRLQLSVFPC